MARMYRKATSGCAFRNARVVMTSSWEAGCRIGVGEHREPDFLSDIEKLRSQDRRVHAPLAQRRQARAGAAGLKDRDVLIGDEAVSL